jgi:4a-hydroxytetrahydrobiopterin dehydratase
MACDMESKIDDLLASDIPEGWVLENIDGIDRLIREYTFNNFISAMNFSNAVAELAERHNHHPLIMTEWGKVSLHWWTHTAQGIAPLDLKLAQLCNTLDYS